jgi:acyl-coenzyme A synthetase/AMP-(fatty) acid ligase
LHRIERQPRSLVYGVPFQFHILQALSKGRVRFDRVISSGSPLPDPLFEALRRSANVVLQQYGCSEEGCLSIGVGIESASDVGKPLAHVDLSVDGEIDGPGEIRAFVRGAGREVRTHDLGVWSREGRLHILARIDDLINVAGLKVIPGEVESVLLRMPGITEAVAHRTRHPVWGEAVKALVVAADPITAGDVIGWCKQHLPPFKVPSAVEIVEEIPKTSGGKISRKLLEKRG